MYSKSRKRYFHAYLIRNYENWKRFETYCSPIKCEISVIIIVTMSSKHVDSKLCTAVNLIWVNLQRENRMEARIVSAKRTIEDNIQRSIDFVSNWTNCDLMKRDYNGDEIINNSRVKTRVVSLVKILNQTRVLTRTDGKKKKRKILIINRVRKFFEFLLFRIRATMI